MTNLVVALRAEAQPLIDSFGLRQVGLPSQVKMFEGNGVSLVISGVGRRVARVAVERLFSRTGRAGDRCWVNIGVAGHAAHELGRLFLAAKIEDATTGRSWTPHVGFPHGLPTAVVRTVERPEDRYDEDVLYDMEAAAFYEAAIRCSARERVQVLKVVSDNRRRPATTLTARKASRLVAEQLPAVERLLSEVERVTSDR